VDMQYSSMPPTPSTVLIPNAYAGGRRSVHGSAGKSIVHTYSILHAYCTHTARTLHAHCTHTARILHAYCTHTARILHAHCTHAARILHTLDSSHDLYTGPQLHTHNYAGGEGDLGPLGMALFFATYEYNTLSKAIGLPEFALSPAERSRVNSTSVVPSTRSTRGKRTASSGTASSRTGSSPRRLVGSPVGVTTARGRAQAAAKQLTRTRTRAVVTGTR
jgi:hypothetical protein